jgi:phage shock protein C
MPDLSRPLRRFRRERMIAGVVGGLAEYFGMDPTLLRVVYVVLSVLTVAVPGILLYLLLWIVIPKAEQEGEEHPDASRRWRRSRQEHMIGGVIGGLAEYLRIDPTLLRAAYVIASVISAAFPGILVYLVLWVVVPQADEGRPA